MAVEIVLMTKSLLLRKNVLNTRINPRLKVIKLFSCSTQLRQKFILLINVKMPTIVGILTFMSRINYQFLSFEPKCSTIFYNFNIYEQLKFHAELS